MNIQGYQKITLLDFPSKVACTVFTGGCNLACPFCHNARLVRAPMAYDSAEAEVLAYLTKRRGIVEGVCITGGEPLLQADLADFMRRVKEMGYAIKLDTNGALPDRLAEILSLGLVDYIAMDIKSSPEGYAKAVGRAVDFAPFAKSIALIRESGIAHEFRTTVVKGIHTKADLVAIAEHIGDEAYFLQGFVDSGALLGEGCEAFSAAEMGGFIRAVRRHTPRAQLRGVEELPT